jgi:N-acetylglutamate synthase-like GNAT family acetyltransferase
MTAGASWASARPVPYYRPLIMLRKATERDLPDIERVMRASLETLGNAYYDARQVASAMTWIARPDPQIVEDRTYFVIEQDGRIVACGGWSRRGKLYAGSAAEPGEGRLLDPSRDAARVRAMFVDPRYARRGLGRAILDACEEEARLAGFRSIELMATLSGEALYAASGYEVIERTEMVLEDGVVLGGAKMAKMLA